MIFLNKIDKKINENFIWILEIHVVNLKKLYYWIFWNRINNLETFLK